SELKQKIGDSLKHKKPLISIYETDFVSQVLALFKDHRVSKLVVISRDFKLKGILAYFDLVSYLVTPKKKQRFSAREGNKIPIFNRQVKNFAKTNVLTLTTNDKLFQAAEMILKNNIGSVIIVDAERHPVGIITTKDLLSIFARQHYLNKLEVITKNLSKQSWVLVSQFVKQINNQLAKFKNISKAKFIVAEKKGGGVFKAVLSILSKDRGIKVIKEEGKNLDKVLQEVKKKSH
ncbi:CBS domain-containing protein, partial [Candidatus Gribaldobacteria bacterium]|nr:CBS domain-containing protein [Candidatus Gribaldobacteria bacterium]